MECQGWNILDADAGVLWREYRFTGKALATTLIFRGVDGGLVVVSPGTGLADSEFDALKEFGEVRAIVANNSFHHLGQKAWRERFPEAKSYAPPRAVEELNKKVPGLAFRPLTELPLPANVRWMDPPGYKTGETILIIETKRGRVWYSGDLLTNIVSLPPPPLRWLFTWTGSAPGFRLLKPAAWMFVKDRKELRKWALDCLEKAPPAIVVPAHGRPVEAPDLVAQTRAQLQRL